jgi:putative protein-disulfide isomerase
VHNNTLKLYYVHDPMCSWCWGLRPVWQEIQNRLPADIPVRYVLGGLARDTAAPMPDSLRATIQATWRRIQQEIPGTEFNFTFWTACQPRRSTWPACRAVLAAANQHRAAGAQMLLAIQKAYYLEARNPSDEAVLVSLAGTLGLDQRQFAAELNSTATKDSLAAEFELRNRLGVHSFPSLCAETPAGLHAISLNYRQAEPVVRQIMAHSEHPLTAV